MHELEPIKAQNTEVNRPLSKFECIAVGVLLNVIGHLIARELGLNPMSLEVLAPITGVSTITTGAFFQHFRVVVSGTKDQEPEIKIIEGK